MRAWRNDEIESVQLASLGAESDTGGWESHNPPYFQTLLIMFYQISLWKPSSEAKRLSNNRSGQNLTDLTTRPKSTLRITIGPCATLARTNTHVAKPVGGGAEMYSSRTNKHPRLEI
jgi:hypothetical protein